MSVQINLFIALLSFRLQKDARKGQCIATEREASEMQRLQQVIFQQAKLEEAHGDSFSRKENIRLPLVFKVIFVEDGFIHTH